MGCPHLSYRRSDGDRSFDEARAYCTVTDSFVQPMRADVCNDRYDLEHDQHCEIYRAHEGLSVVATDHPGSGDPAGSTEQ